MTFQEWFEGIRVGLDFGPKGVGVAVVRQQSVLFAQSLLNLGSIDVEGRRTHRRSRRTHRMRQRRLRKFRRYCIENGLPDPVPLAHTSTAPHPLLKSTHVSDPRWQDLRRVRERLLAGKGSPEDFVRFCYDLCRRRGFTYGSLEETVRRALRPKRGKPPTPAEVEEALKKEFESAQMSEIAAQRILNLLRSGGYDTLAEPTSTLGRLLQEAVHRPSGAREPRTKRPRDAVRKELVAVCEANLSFAKHETPIWEIIDWQPRPLRIDNRASTMWRCSWCKSRWRPRLSNLVKDKDPLVRNGLLWEAVHNLRHKPDRSTGENVRPWWAARYANAFKKKGLPPTDDVRQAVFKALKETPKDADRPEVLDRIGAIFKRYRLVDAEKQKFADLLRPREKDEGRSQRCRECIRKGAQAKTAEDYRQIRDMIIGQQQVAEHRTQMEAWLDRCIKAIKKSLFYYDPNGTLRFRYGSVVSVSLEVPKYDPEEGTAARQRTEDAQRRREWPFLRQRYFQQRGTCLYCGEKRFELQEERRADGSIRYRLPTEFEEEHVFPSNDRYHGQNLQVNKVVACVECNLNLKKGRSSWHWLQDTPEKWGTFEQRVNESLLPQPTKELLLSKDDRYPELVEFLSKSSQIRKTLATKLKEAFQEAGVVLSDQQIVFTDGMTTQLARRSWNAMEEDTGKWVENFPIKDRDHPAHHAQDAVLAAGIPPHYLRRIGEWLLPPSGQARFVGRPNSTYAPNWPAYESKTKRKPLSIDLTTRRFDWHARQWNDSIYSRDAGGRFLIRKAIEKIDPDDLPEGSEWAKQQLLAGKTDLVDPWGKKVRALKVIANDVGDTSAREERPGTKRWRKSLLERPWLALRAAEWKVECCLPKPGEKRLKPKIQDGWWTLERGHIVWLAQDQIRKIGPIQHTWKRGWYWLTKISGSGDQLTLKPCDEALPFREAEVKKGGKPIIGKDGKPKKKKEYADLTLSGDNLLKLRWPPLLSKGRNLPEHG